MTSNNHTCLERAMIMTAIFGVFHKTALYDDDSIFNELVIFEDQEDAEKKYQEIVDENDYEGSPNEELCFIQLCLFKIEPGILIDLDQLEENKIKEIYEIL